MYQVVPGTFTPASNPTGSTGTVNNVSSGREMNTPYNTISTPWLPKAGSTISWTPAPSPQSTIGDYEVNIEQVQNGFIVTAKNHVLVAVDMVQLTDVLTKFFNGEYE
jgi:hypothetical protein